MEFIDLILEDNDKSKKISCNRDQLINSCIYFNNLLTKFSEEKSDTTRLCLFMQSMKQA